MRNNNIESNNRRNTANTYRGSGAYNNSAAYQYGSAAPAYEPRRSNPNHQERPERRTEHRKSKFSLVGTILVAAAFAFLAIKIVDYVRIQSELTSTVKAVASKEVQLSKITSDNDELYSRIISSIDLGRIETIAREELGMSYATEGQIITYTPVTNDYMRKVDSNK